MSRTSTHYVRKLLGGLTCEEFAKEFGIPVGTVRNWDARKTFPVYMEALVLRAACVKDNEVAYKIWKKEE